MALCALGLNHATAPVEVRERVAFPPDALADALRDLVGARTGEGSRRSCRRAIAPRVYFHGGDPEPVAQWLARFPQSAGGSRCHPYVLHAAAAIKP